jgi:hypothetical protein
VRGVSTLSPFLLTVGLALALLVPCPSGSAASPVALRPLERCYTYLSLGDARFAAGWQPADSPATIDAMFDWVAGTYHSQRMFWREEQSWRRHFQVGEASPAQGPLIYDYTTRWAAHLDDDLRCNEVAVAAAKRHGMQIFLYTGLFDHGPQPDVGVLCPYLFEDRLRLEHPEWCPVDRWGERRQPGPLEFCYPEARRALVERYVEDVTRGGYDGIGFYTYVENFGLRYPDETGFNQPIVDEFRRRHGVDIRTQPFDRQAWYRLRGEYLTQFLRELYPALAARGKRMSVNITPENEHFGHSWYATFPDARGKPGAGMIYLDWETWAREGIVDELNANWLGDQRALLTRMLEVCKGTPCKLTVYSVLPSEEHHGTRQDWQPFLDAGVTPVLEIGTASAWSTDRVTLEPTSLATLANPDWRLRAQSLADIVAGTLRAGPADAVPLARDAHVLVRRQALLALGALQAADQVPVLEEALADAENSVRCAAAQALARVRGQQTPERILAALLRHDHVQFRQACIAPLVNAGEGAQALLVAGLQSPSVFVREVCVRSLGLGTLPGSLGPLLAALASDPDHRVRYWALEAMNRYDDPRVLPALLAALGDPAVTVQLMAANCLGPRAAKAAAGDQDRVLAALEARFREYGDGCSRTDAAYGWRVLGNALVASGPRGAALVESMRAPRNDRWLAWIAYEVLYVPQAADRVLLCDEAQAIATHAKYAPPFPGWRRW